MSRAAQEQMPAPIGFTPRGATSFPGATLVRVLPVFPAFRRGDGITPSPALPFARRLSPLPPAPKDTFPLRLMAPLASPRQAAPAETAPARSELCLRAVGFASPGAARGLARSWRSSRSRSSEWGRAEQMCCYLLILQWNVRANKIRSGFLV